MGPCPQNRVFWLIVPVTDRGWHRESRELAVSDIVQSCKRKSLRYQHSSEDKATKTGYLIFLRHPPTHTHSHVFGVVVFLICLMISNFEIFHISSCIPICVFSAFSFTCEAKLSHLNCDDFCWKFIWLLNTKVKPLLTSKVWEPFHFWKKRIQSIVLTMK